MVQAISLADGPPAAAPRPDAAPSRRRRLAPIADDQTLLRGINTGDGITQQPPPPDKSPRNRRKLALHLPPPPPPLPLTGVSLDCGSDSVSDSASVVPATPPRQLSSPRKTAPLPRTPHRPSSDAFWSEATTSAWVERHSPVKPVATTAAKKPKAPVPARAAARRRSFDGRKEDLARAFLAELDERITGGQLAALAAETGGVQIEWTRRLNTTAGRAHWRREVVRDGGATRHRHFATIEVATKVIDSEERLTNVVAHEFCHLASFMLSAPAPGLVSAEATAAAAAVVQQRPHGPEFRAWAARCSREFASRGVRVTTRHSYEIAFKYVWTCVQCGLEYGRHSRSIDVARSRCGACRGALAQTRPVPRGGRGRGGTGADEQTQPRKDVKAPSTYQTFVRQHMRAVREACPGICQKDVMRLVAEKWTLEKKEQEQRRKQQEEEQSVETKPHNGLCREGDDGVEDVEADEADQSGMEAEEADVVDGLERLAL